ncbi:MAG: phosphoenolpyruvate carboxylase [Candidatus Bathyarchaeia archaeon]
MGPDEEETPLSILNKSRLAYERIVEDLAPLISRVASHLPQRRARKLHIGLFFYSRNVAGTHLPRAIPFTTALYSLGMPPEIIGTRFLANPNEVESDTLQEFYLNIKSDIRTAGGYLSWQNLNMLMDIRREIAGEIRHQ